MEVSARIVQLRLAETFVISRGSADSAEVVHVAITHDGFTGPGAAAPNARYVETAAPAPALIHPHGAPLGHAPLPPRGARRPPRGCAAVTSRVAGRGPWRKGFIGMSAGKAGGGPCRSRGFFPTLLRVHADGHPPHASGRVSAVGSRIVIFDAAYAAERLTVV